MLEGNHYSESRCYDSRCSDNNYQLMHIDCLFTEHVQICRNSSISWLQWLLAIVDWTHPMVAVANDLTWLICCALLGLCMKAVSRRSFSIIWMHVSSHTTRRLSGCAIITIRVSLSLYTACCRFAVMSRNSRYEYICFDFCLTTNFRRVTAGWAFSH